jgi:hypothetical protein
MYKNLIKNISILSNKFSNNYFYYLAWLFPYYEEEIMVN